MTFSLMDRGASPPPADRPGESPRSSPGESILRDYRIAFESREVSLLGERQVFTGKAKFGISRRQGGRAGGARPRFRPATSAPASYRTRR